jgi:CheY-like chemotaxis protein
MDANIGAGIVVVIDDQPETLDLLTAILQMGGYEVHAANSGRAGLDLILSLAPAVVVSDVAMPGLSGLQVLSQVKADPAAAAIPIILVSSDGLPGDIRRGLDAGAYAYLTKPVDPALLLNTIDAAIRQP